jgi:integrase
VTLWGKSLDEVKAKVRELDRRQIASFDSQKQTLDGYLERWLATIEANRQPTTHQLYKGIVNNYISPHIGALKLSRIKRRDIRLLVEVTLRERSAKTRQMVYRVLHYALSQAVEDELIVSNPCFKKDKPKYVPGDHEVLTVAEARQLLEAAKNGDHYLLICLALVTGMRQGEIFGLRWDAVDWDSSSIYVRVTLTKDKHGNPSLSPPKASRHRRIDLGATVMTMLKEHRKNQRPLGHWVFTDINGEPLNKDRFIRTVFKPLLTAAGVKPIRFHDLRHTSATLALSNGDNVKVVAERLGHASSKMTLDVYTRAVPSLQKEAATKMDDLLLGYGATFGATPKSENPQTLIK